MPVNLTAPDAASLLPVAGVELGTARAGIRKPGRRETMRVVGAGGTSGFGCAERAGRGGVAHSTRIGQRQIGGIMRKRSDTQHR